MPEAAFRFYEELNDFLPKHRKKTIFQVEFKGKRSIRDVIEALGVPHTEVDLVLINGKSVGFEEILGNGDRVSVYPVFESLNIKNVTHLRRLPLRRTKFIADVNLGDIVKYMRLLGLDVYCDPSLSERDIIEISNKENRIILTKSKKLLKFKDVTHGVFVHPGTTQEQIRRIIEFLDIGDNVKPFSRCLCCNSLLVPVRKEEILERIPPKTKSFCSEYALCQSCDKIYWKRAHFIRMKEVIETFLSEL